MTASEANRQRVLTLLHSLTEQVFAQRTTIEEKSPAVQRGRPQKVIVEPSPVETLF